MADAFDVCVVVSKLDRTDESRASSKLTDILHLSTESPIKSGGMIVMSYLQWRRAGKE